MLPVDSWGSDPVRDNFFAAIFNNPDAFDAPVCISVDEFRKYLVQSTAAGVVKEDVMNHFWEIDNKPVRINCTGKRSKSICASTSKPFHSRLMADRDQISRIAASNGGTSTGLPNTIICCFCGK